MNRILIASVSLLGLAGIASAQDTLQGHAQSDGRISIERAVSAPTISGSSNFERPATDGPARGAGATFTTGGYGDSVSSENVYSGK